MESILADPTRLEALRKSGLLELSTEEPFDRITSMAARILETPCCFFSLLEADWVHYKSHSGLPQPIVSKGQPLDCSLCKYVVSQKSPLSVPDTTEHPEMSSNRAVTEMGCRSFLGVPVFAPGGEVLGALCVLDFEPRDWDDNDIQTLIGLCGALAGEIALKAEVSQRRRMEVELRKSELRFRNLVENSVDLVWEMDVAGRLLYVNDAAIEVLGTTPEALVGQRLFDLLTERSAAHDLVDAGLLEGKGFRDLKTSLRRADGGVTHLESSGFPLLDSNQRIEAVVGTSRDTSKKDKMDNFLREVVRTSTEDLSRVNRSLNQAQRLARLGNWTWHGPAGQLEWREGAVDLFGEEACREIDTFEKLLQRVDFDSRPGLTQAMADCFSDEQPLDFRFRLSLAGRKPMMLRAMAEWVQTLDAAPAMLGTFQDVTGEEALQNQLRQAQKMDAVGRLAGGIAHDFNNLLCGMIGFGEFAQMELSSDHPAHADVQEVVATAHRAARLTSQLLMFSSRSSGTLVDVDVNAAVDQLSRMLQRLLGPSIVYENVLDESVWNIQVDRSGFEQVLVNLVVNARDAMAGSGRLTVSTRNERVAGKLTSHFQNLSGDYTVVEVRDSGPGIPGSVLPRIFEPFFTTKAAGSGTGLGLSVCFGIVEQAGGAIDVLTSPTGSTFSIYLPKREDLLDHPERHADFTHDLPSGNGELILVVDIEELVLKVLERTLVALNYEVKTFDSPEKLLEQAADLATPSLLVTEYVLPNFTGVELSRRFKELQPNVKTLVMCADLPRDLGASDIFLVKPFGRDRLVSAVRQSLDSVPS